MPVRPVPRRATRFAGSTRLAGVFSVDWPFFGSRIDSFLARPSLSCPYDHPPGTYVEEIAARAKAIVGADTSTTALVGLARNGPVNTVSDLLTCFADFERIYGDTADLDPMGAGVPTTHYLAHAVAAYFNEGGQRLHVVRVAPPENPEAPPGLPARPSPSLAATSLRIAATGVTPFSPSLAASAVRSDPRLEKLKPPASPAPGAPVAPPRLSDWITAIDRLDALADVSIIAAPGHAEFGDEIAVGVARHLIASAEKPGAFRFAILDPPRAASLGGSKRIQDYRAQFDSKSAALYYPWIVVAEPAVAGCGTSSSPVERVLPPSGFICGIYARVERLRGVAQAPANEIINTALRLEPALPAEQQAALGSLGINCLRFVPGRGTLVWGARTLASDPEGKYVNVRRYLLYLERSIIDGLQWAASAPNDERLWASIRSLVDDFLLNEWRRGALVGLKPEQAYFVRCDRTTMTQADLLNGRLVCLIGVAPLKPAEFMILNFTLTAVPAE